MRPTSYRCPTSHYTRQTCRTLISVWMCIKGDGDGSSAVGDYVAQLRTDLRQQPAHEPDKHHYSCLGRFYWSSCLPGLRVVGEHLNLWPVDSHFKRYFQRMRFSHTHGYTCLGDGHWTECLSRVPLFGKGHYARVCDSHWERCLQKLWSFVWDYHPFKGANHWSRCLSWLHVFEKHLYACVFGVRCGRSLRWRCFEGHNPIKRWRFWSNPHTLQRMEETKPL